MNQEAKAGVSPSTLALWLVSLAISVAPLRAVADPGTTTAWDWGFNAYGQLGNGSSIGSDLPVSTIPQLESVTKIAGGAWHNLALKRNGSSTVWAWGDNVYGQLGTTTAPFTNSEVPVQVFETWFIFGEPFDIAAGGDHSLALVNSNGSTTVWAWGDNCFGQLGDGNNTNFPLPVPVRDLGGLFPSGAATAVAIAAGEWHSLALTQNGSSTVWAWGNNAYGQLGDGSNVDSWFATPVSTSTGLGDDRLIAIAAGDRHSLALSQSGQVWAWGWNAYGQLGNNSITNSVVPVRLSTSTPMGIGDDKVIAIAAGAFHSLALGESGTVYAWGSNGFGQLGNNSIADSLVPVRVSTSTPSGLGNDTVAIAAGGIHSLALTKNGSSTWAWGDNNFGELGDSTTTNSPIPVLVSGGHYASAIAGGWLHSLAIFEEVEVSGCSTATWTVLTPSSTTVGLPVTDTAYVQNSGVCPDGNPGGSVTFSYQAPGTTTWTALETDALTVGSPSSVTSTPFNPTVAGTYHFKAVYGGDSFHSASTSSDEVLTVTNPALVPTTVTTRLSSSYIQLHGTATDTVAISSVVAGPAGGTYTIEASRTPDFSGAITVAGGVVGPSLPFTAISPGFRFDLPGLGSGLWYIRAHYTGDSTYAESYSGNLDETFYVFPY